MSKENKVKGATSEPAQTDNQPPKRLMEYLKREELDKHLDQIDTFCEKFSDLQQKIKAVNPVHPTSHKKIKTIEESKNKLVPEYQEKLKLCRKLIGMPIEAPYITSGRWQEIASTQLKSALAQLQAHWAELEYEIGLKRSYFLSLLAIELTMIIGVASILFSIFK
ncbi:MAG: hypothetical protein A2052_06260 [Deltaproteobacteria bacterium GWA2_54_12]|nr:MAG: hypothetical protein A2052_06260 [Deltaproteobacteria bacterium GWA2_54_12]